ncbi:DUF4365 domain-containing protein [Sphingobacterium multivorum]|uniref:DUF4365 domain-containing protein n=1 Tax=Sphingobacterium multivorum TaxID=28454 RepID=UPI00289A0911|nr:DUF4365 domain-containing protein [Sphingobacterium multivorum]
MKHNIFDLNLPKDSRNKQLEVISRDHFRPLFDVKRFLIKEEHIDNGVDFRIEVKVNACVTGFGFNFQLKSTESIKPNSDGSYSKNIETTNIEYLLNNGQPAFYGFYVDAENLFYYTDLKKVVFDLNLKNPQWQSQSNHTVRFADKLDPEAINDIYSNALTEGQMLRMIQSSLAQRLANQQLGDKIIIDLNSKVITDSKIIDLIENYGLLMIDECRWTDVINLHKQSTSAHERSPKYNLVIGVSFYYAGEFFKAMDYLRETNNQLQLLETYLKEYMLFFYYSLQRIFHIISEEEYLKLSSTFSESSDITLHKRLEEAAILKGEMFSSKEFVSKQFEDIVKDIIENPTSSSYIKLLAKIEFAYYRSEQFICRLIMMLELGHKKQVDTTFNAINQEFHDLMNESMEINSNFGNHLCGMKHSSFIIHFDCIYRRHQKSNVLDEVLPGILENIEKSHHYFCTINHVENELYSLSVLLEYYQNLEDQNKISEVEKRLYQYKSKYGNHEFNRKIDFTTNGGTFVSHIIAMAKNVDLVVEESKQMEKEMEEIERAESIKVLDLKGDHYTIHLMPLGYFQLPADKTETLFNILKITDVNLKNQLTDMFKQIIPVINCFPPKILKEGPLRGMMEDQGMPSRRNIHRIRKELFLNEFPRKR